MRILFVLENYLPHLGGAEIVFKNLAEGLVKSGHQVDLVTHQLKNTKKFEIINGVKVYRVACLDNRYLFTFLSIPTVLRLAKKADLIQTTTFNGAPPAWLAAKLRSKPSVLTVHEVWINRWLQVTEMTGLTAKMHDLLERMIYLLKFDPYVCVSRSTQKQLLSLPNRIPEQKTAVIYNGLDYDHWNEKKINPQLRRQIRQQWGLNEKRFVYLYYGRPGTSKGLKYLLRAVPEISCRLPNSRLVLLLSQDPAYQQNYLQALNLIKKLKIKDQIAILPPISYEQLPFQIKAADVVVVPSLAEGFGFSAAQACAAGVPVAVSKIDSLPEVVSGKVVLFPAKNPSAVAQAVVAIAQKKYAQTPKKHFYIHDNIKNYLKVYEELLRKSH